MEKEELLDKVLAMLSGDMDDMEGSEAMKHSQEDCPDPLGCTMHDSELGDSLTGLDKPDGLKLEVSKVGLAPGASEEGEKGGLSPEEADALRKLLR